MTIKTRQAAQKKIVELQDKFAETQKKYLAEMIKLADVWDLSFYYRGSTNDYSGRYYGGPLSRKEDGMEDTWLSDGWHDSACY